MKQRSGCKDEDIEMKGDKKTKTSRNKSKID